MQSKIFSSFWDIVFFHFRNNATPTTGKPLVKAQNSDFLKQKVADQRQTWKKIRQKLNKFNASVNKCVDFENVFFCQKLRFRRLRQHLRTMPHAPKQQFLSI